MSGAATRSSYLLERAWVDGVVRDDVLVEIEDGRFTAVTPATSGEGNTVGARSSDAPSQPRDHERVPGLTLPGLANCHSHAFHRALRGRTQRERGTFWTWREQMYGVAARLDPDSYLALARAVYREMAVAGVTSVGEFHYLHHQPDGTPYDEPNAMGLALLEAGREAGIRVVLLDTCYLSSGFGEPPAGVQVRYADRDAEAWADARGRPADRARRGRATRCARCPTTSSARSRDAAGDRPLHVHLSEQTAENDACVAAYGATPAQLLADHGLLGPRTTAVHATHLTGDDVGHLGSTATYACFCPTTERDLGDGIGPSRALLAAGSPLTLGSDSHAVIDLFEEMRAVELDERLASQSRGHWTAAELLDAATHVGHASLGLDDVGRIAVGQRADLVTVDASSVRTAGTGADEHTAVFAATAEDVVRVVVDGRVVVREGDRAEVGRELDAVIGELWR